MSKRLSFIVSFFTAGLLVVALVAPAAAEVFVRIQTEAGDMTMVMSPEKAPNHVNSFLHLCRTGFYQGTYFHRVIPGFMIQGGDPNTLDEDPDNDGMGSPTLADVLPADVVERVNEVNKLLDDLGWAGFASANLKAEFNDAPHMRGTLSMARSQNPDSAGSQFFVCHQAATHLDGNYTVFGQTFLGLDVIDAIVSAPTRPGGQNKPVEPVHILSTEVIESVEDLNETEQAAWQAHIAPAEGE